MTPVVRQGPPKGSVLPLQSTELLFEQHGRYVWRALRGFGVPERDVPDLIQEVFMVVHTSRDAFEGRSRVTTWLYGIAFRVASVHRRKAGNRYEELSVEMPEPSFERTPDREVESFSQLQRLEASLGELDEAKRDVFVLYEIEELAMTEIAEVVGCPLQTAYSRLKAAREHVMRSFRRTERLEGGSS